MKTTPLILIALLAVSSCKKIETVSETVEIVPASPELTAVFKPASAKEIGEIHSVRMTAKPGDKLVIKGRVMGAASPFVVGRAAFVLGDEELLTACSDTEDDHCKTPWDNCCDTKEAFRDGTATIQVVDADGRVLKEGIEGVEGLEKLSRVVIEGVVAEGSSAENLVINANGIQVVE